MHQVSHLIFYFFHFLVFERSIKVVHEELILIHHQ